MKEPTVSVAMATYNGERFLQEQLDSLTRQTLLPRELIACDDGSTDGTLDVLHRYAKDAPFPVRVYRNETRLGPGFNFLRAISFCSGEFVAFCDQDDIWKEQKLRVCADVMQDPAITLVSHSALVISQKPLPRLWRRPDHRSSVCRSCCDLPVHNWPVLGFSMVLRRKVLERARVPAYSPALAPWCVHDAWATLAALACGPVVLLPDELALYRLHESNVALRPRAAGVERLAPDPSVLEGRPDGSARRFFRYAASFCDETARGTFEEWADRCERVRRLYDDRARLHRACGRRFTAIRILAGMLARGDYGPGRLGVKALARDTFLATFWPGQDSAD